MVRFILFLCWTGDLPQLPSADEFTPRAIDLSKATKLKDVVLRCGSPNNEWVTTTLETVTFQHQDLQQISIHIPPTLSHAMPGDDATVERVEGADPQTQWSDLDRLLVRFWDTRSIRPKVVYPRTKDSGGGGE